MQKDKKNKYVFLVVYMLDNMIHNNSKIQWIIEKTSKRIILKGKKSFKNTTQAQKNAMHSNK